MFTQIKWVTMLFALAVTPAPGTTRADAPKPGRLPAATLNPPDYLPQELREVLRRRMGEHGRDMQELVFQVVLLQREGAMVTARRIASEPRLARPLPGGEGDLNALLPERFFVFQDDLKRMASQVADAASRKNDAQLASAFGRMTETCVACHSAYLKGAKR